ncbi:MAG: hypothetical protein K9M54_11455 [Kiritimatiellales bacterium]|nr:hypothetical protein [Kiritimatiellales bacterium]
MAADRGRALGWLGASAKKWSGGVGRERACFATTGRAAAPTAAAVAPSTARKVRLLSSSCMIGDKDARS